MGVEPLQLPGSAWSVWPFCAVPVMVGGDVFDGGVAAPDAPAPVARPRKTTRASVPRTPSEAPRSAERCFVVEDMDRPPSSEMPLCVYQTRGARRSVALVTSLYLRLANLLPDACIFTEGLEIE